MKNPSVSAIIVNWNHGRLLRDCVDRLLAQGYSPLDITVVDNGSQDGSPDRIARDHPAVHLVSFSENLGFAHALNWGITHTQGDYVLSLNPDAMVHKGFVSELVRAVHCAEKRGERVGMAAPKLLMTGDPGILDSTGLFVDRRRRPYDRGQGEPDRGQYDAQQYAFGACGGAALYRRAMLEDLALGGEYFDEVFFAYYEDADLAWRAQSRGWRCVYASRAVATHDRGWGDTLRKRGRAARDTTGPRLALRNRYLMTVKNDTLGHFLVDLPLILAAELPRLAYIILTRPSILLGLVELVRALPSALRKRRQIRTRQTADDHAVRRWFVAPLDAATDSGHRC